MNGNYDSLSLNRLLHQSRSAWLCMEWSCSIYIFCPMNTVMLTGQDKAHSGAQGWKAMKYLYSSRVLFQFCVTHTVLEHFHFRGLLLHYCNLISLFTSLHLSITRMLQNCFRFLSCFYGRSKAWCCLRDWPHTVEAPSSDLLTPFKCLSFYENIWPPKVMIISTPLKRR